MDFFETRRRMLLTAVEILRRQEPSDPAASAELRATTLRLRSLAEASGAPAAGALAANRETALELRRAIRSTTTVGPIS